METNLSYFQKLWIRPQLRAEHHVNSERQMNHFASPSWKKKIKMQLTWFTFLIMHFKKCSRAQDSASWGFRRSETVYVMTTAFWKMPLSMGKLTRPSGIMISAISITTFRQIHYLLASLPGRTAKHCSRMEWERKTLNSALLPTEKKKKVTLWVILFLSKSQAFISTAFTLYSGGRTWATHNIEHGCSIPLSGCRRIFLHSSHLCSSSILSPCHPKLFSRIFFLASSSCNIHSIIQDFNIHHSIIQGFDIHAKSTHGFQTTLHRKFRLQNKGLFHISIFKQQGLLWSCILPSSIIQNKILYPVISAARLSFLTALQHLQAETILSGRFQIEGACPNALATVSRSLLVSL